MPCCRLRYTISLQAVLAPGDQVIQVVLAGSIDNSTGERPIIAYLFGVEATSLINQTSLGVVGALITVQLCRAAKCSGEVQLVLVACSVAGFVWCAELHQLECSSSALAELST